MNDDEKLVKKRFEELAKRCDTRGGWVFSEFLNPAEQDILCKLKLNIPYTLQGGYPTAERRLVAFGSEEVCGYSQPPPICCLWVLPSSRKFADTLGHRDFLGSLIGLGIRREVLGDIVVQENAAYLFCMETIAAFIIQELTQVKHTAVNVTKTEALELKKAEPPEITQEIIASERLDAIIAAVYKLSRGESQSLVEQGLVSVNSRPVENTSRELKLGDLISVRGHGRFSYEGIEAETRKGRLRVSVRVY